MKQNRFAVDRKITETETRSPNIVNVTKPRHLQGLVIGAAIVTAAILVLHKPVAGASDRPSGDGATAPWEKTGGPPGLTFKAIYKTNNIVYAGTDTQGIYKSTDDGLNWVAANTGIERAAVSDIIASGGNVLAAASSSCSIFNNVFKSTDNGTTWSPTTGLSGNIVNSFAIKGSSIYATFGALPNNSGIARSTDNGNTWQIVPSII